jgi:DNA-3-methyladenine glycosylase
MSVRAAKTMASNSRSSFEHFFARDPVAVACDLIGASFEVGGCGGIIVEAEAYRHDDPASHSYRGESNRNRSMFGAPGTAYVYRSYGVHWCLNFVCNSKHRGCAVLIRALEPKVGLRRMRARRGMDDARALCSGPGKLTSALSITGDLDGLPLDGAPFELTLSKAEAVSVVSGTRIGITRAMDLPWRFGLAGSRFLSRRFR